MLVFNKLSNYIIYIKKSDPTPMVEFIQKVYPRCINGNLSGLDKKYYTGCSYGLFVYSPRNQCIIYNSYVNYRYMSCNDELILQRHVTKYLHININDRIYYTYELNQHLNIIKWIVKHAKYTSEKNTTYNYIKSTIDKILSGKRGGVDYDQHIEYNYINHKINYVRNRISNYGMSDDLNIIMIAKYKKGKIYAIKIKKLNCILDVLKVEKYVIK